MTLEGAVDGLLELALPDWDKLKDPFVSIPFFVKVVNTKTL